MAISRPPSLMGSSIRNECGTQSIWNAAPVVRLANQGMMSRFAGLSKEVVITLNWDDWNYPSADLVNRMSNAIGGNWNNAAIIVNITGRYVAPNTGTPCLWFGGAMANVAYIRLNITGRVYGRGGNGAESGSGTPGGPAIQNDIGGKLQINNNGIISGGGAGANSSTRTWTTTTGVNNTHETTHTLTSPGNGGSPFGLNGGGGQVGLEDVRLGQNFGNISAGASILGTAPAWLNPGDIRGWHP